MDLLRSRPDGIATTGTDFQTYEAEGFATPSGKLEFYSRQLEDQGHWALPAFKDRGRDPIRVHPRHQEFPLIGISGARSKNFTHSQFKNIPALLQREPQGFVDIHPVDASPRAIADGDRVKVETPRGHLYMPARITDAVHPGAVRIAWGWGEVDPQANLNNLTDDGPRDLVTGTPANRSFMCNVTKVLETAAERLK